MITVPSGSTLTLRCYDQGAGVESLALISLAETRAEFVAELPPIPVLSLDDPGVRRAGVLELVSSAGVTWVEAELRGGLLTILGDTPTDIVQRRTAARRMAGYSATGTAQIDSGLVAMAAQVEDISTDGVLLRVTDRPRLPDGITRTLLHVAMPWGLLTASVTTVDQRADLLRGTFEWVDPAGAAALHEYCAAR
ncbi:hypothetical protein BJ973_009725 [Actinoplanes tereljensis]|uniref:PilZ domain-containing protein n=1 Tax=Paractinoplanes tereljensis TaxID=571912 RepID=A0A919TNX2_9ACTN|nr:hypothetical protein [Actinoplanes tereljensis]GIF17313.1 hypothetical protein Ate02nite_00430 [Actinoplanes tereljensis]